MSKQDHWMPLYIADYLKDTMHLTAEAHGAYLLLILHYWSNGGAIKYDEDDIFNICRLHTTKQPKKILEKILPFFHVENGFLHHKRIDRELQKAKEIVAKRVEAGKKSGVSRKAKTEQETNTCSTDVPTNDEQNTRPLPSPLQVPTVLSIGLDKSKPHPPKQPSLPKNYPPEFEEFWTEYPKTHCSKSEAAKAYQKAIQTTGVTHEKLISSLREFRKYLEATGTPAAHPTTFLNQRRWEVDYDAALREHSRIATVRSFPTEPKRSESAKCFDETSRIIAERNRLAQPANNGIN